MFFIKRLILPSKSSTTEEFTMLALIQYGRVCFTFLILLFSLSGCSSHLMQKKPLTTTDTLENRSSDDHEFVAVGYAAIATQKGDSDDVKMLNAIKASKLDAYKELAEQIYGVMLTSENTIEQHQLQDEVLEVKVTGLVRGAKVLRTYHEGNLYITELALKMKTLPGTDFVDFSSSNDVIHVQPSVYY
jgi:hypothetical protein